MSSGEAPPFAGGRPLYYSHVQKTGGTSLRRVLERLVPLRHFHPAPANAEGGRGEPVDDLPEADAFTALPEARLSDLWIVADHLPPFLADRLPVRPWLAITLRDPIDRSLSHLAHLSRFDERYEWRRPSRLIENRGVRRRLVDDYQTRFLSAYDLPTARVALRPREVTRADLDRAIEWVEAADVLLLTERLSDSVALLGATLGINIGSPPRTNEADPKFRPDYADPVFRDRIAQHVPFDLELYDVARKRFEALLSAHNTETAPPGAPAAARPAMPPTSDQG